MIKKYLTRTKSFRALWLMLFFIVQIQYSAFGQKSILDSLRNELNLVKPNLNSSLRDSSYVNILNTLATEIRYKKRDSLLKLSEEAIRYSKIIGYRKGEVEAYINLGGYHSDGGNYPKAVALITKALKQSRVYQLNNLELRSINYLGMVHRYQDKNELSLKDMLAGIDIATKLDDRKFLSLFNMNIGNLYLSLNEYSEALNYYEISKKFGDSYGNETILAYINSNLAAGYNHVNEPETAMTYIDAAISTFEKNNTTDWLAFAYRKKGQIYLQQADYKTGLSWLEQSEKLYTTIVDNERHKSYLLLGLAEANLNLDRDSISKIQAKRAYDLAGILKDKNHKKNASKLLYLLYKKKNDLAESFKYLEIFQQLSDTLANDESKKSMLMLKTRMDYEKQKQDLIENNEKALTKRTNIIASILALLLILIGFILLVLKNQKIQKKLNQELKESETELIEINETKNKLFSIVSHDLREPVRAFSNLMDLFSQGEIQKDQFLSFIPKLKSDINYISFTLNNLLSWGQGQMKGSFTKPVVVDLENIVTTNINLLSEIAFNKSIQVLNKLEQNTITWSDRDQIDVVVRNLLSNALKFTPKNGSVIITALENKQYWEVSIKDTGVGMDKQVKNEIFEYNSNITTYGTNNEKGTGLGLILCKELIEKNKGTIWVNSTLNEGTCFKFTVPKSKQIYDLVG
jgi:signal transduction histidine kinase